ncbi:MAG: hypothetical protein JXL97_07725 [Bacteroidales bacterium]|nr:hypothetical protein [Bacteroidales bacterium]
MNKIYKLLIIFIIISQSIFAQTYPETFNYQAVARNDDGSPIANEEIVVEVSILSGADCDDNETGCNVVWQELHFPTTNNFGLFSINIGDGQNTFAGSETTFSNINWNDFSSGNYFLKLRVDFGNSGYGNGLIDMGVVLFQSVPYSFSAEKAIDIERQTGKVPFNLTELLDVNIATLTTDEVLSWNGTNWVNTTVSAAGANALNELSDVTLAGTSTNQVLLYNGTNWANTSMQITQLSNVTTTAPANGQVLKYNGTNWINNSLTTSDITDLSISGQTVGQALIWDGTDWSNQDIAASSAWTEDATYVYYNGGKNVGIGTATPTAFFQVATSANQGVLFTGTYNAIGTVANLGAGTRMSFYPSKSAFRAGTVSGTQWDDASVGDYSSAFGLNTTASGDYSFAAGRLNTSVGVYSTAFGYNNSASGVASLAVGATNIAVGLNAFVCGTNNNATAGIDGDNSIVGGSGNDGFSQNSLTIGIGNDNNGANSIVFGQSSKTDANGAGSLAGGNTTIARGNYSVAFGLGTTAQAYASLVIGRYNTISGDQLTWIATEPIFVVGNGTSSGTRNNALVIRKNGDIVNETGVYATGANPSKASQIVDFSNILLLNGFSENKNGTNYFGFQASEVEKFFPDLVTNFNDTKAINYTGFVPLIIETVKAQQTTIDNLQKENADLKQKLNDFETRLQNLENQN